MQSKSSGVWTTSRESLHDVVVFSMVVRALIRIDKALLQSPTKTLKTNTYLKQSKKELKSPMYAAVLCAVVAVVRQSQTAAFVNVSCRSSYACSVSQATTSQSVSQQSCVDLLVLILDDTQVLPQVIQAASVKQWRALTSQY
jgi:hypothetical protein